MKKRMHNRKSMRMPFPVAPFLMRMAGGRRRQSPLQGFGCNAMPNTRQSSDRPEPTPVENMDMMQGFGCNMIPLLRGRECSGCQAHPGRSPKCRRCSANPKR